MLEEEDDVLNVVINDKEAECVQIAGIVYQGKYYVIVQPVESEDDTAYVCLASFDEDGNDVYQLVEDEALVKAVYKKYDDLLGGEISKLDF